MDLTNLKVVNGKKIFDTTLYSDQKKALDILYDWYKSPSLEFTLGGCAGTGKTYLLQYFIKHCVDKSFTITAPTHKALRVLESTIGRRGKTLHAIHGLKPNMDLSNFDIENPQYDKNGSPLLPNYNLIIIDECSMINEDLFNLTKKESKLYNVKILYVGDPLQLPPVKEQISLTFSNVKESYILKDIIRQEEGNPLLELFSLLRYDILNDKDTFLRHIVKNRNNIIDDIGYEILPITEFKKQVVDMFKSTAFKEDIDHIRITGFTNQCITDWNQYIRDETINKNIPIVCIDDLFTSYNSIINEFKDLVILNSDDYILHDIRDYISDEGIKTFAVNLKSMYDGKLSPIFLIVDHKDKSFEKYIQVLNYFHEFAIQGKNKGWVSYFKFKNRFLTLVPITLPTSNRTVKKDLDYGYSLTTHKLQGSTFNNIAIDLTDMVYVNTRNGRMEVERLLRNKLIYVALSRARYKAILKY